MNGHRQIRARVPLQCLDKGQIWLGTFGDFLPGCMRLKGRAAHFIAGVLQGSCGGCGVLL